MTSSIRSTASRIKRTKTLRVRSSVRARPPHVASRADSTADRVGSVPIRSDKRRRRVATRPPVRKFLFRRRRRVARHRSGRNGWRTKRRNLNYFVRAVVVVLFVAHVASRVCSSKTNRRPIDGDAFACDTRARRRRGIRWVEFGHVVHSIFSFVPALIRHRTRVILVR